MCEIDKEVILSLYPEYTTVHGPYLRKDGRKHVVLYNKFLPTASKNKKKTVSYPKILYEVHFGIRLGQDETIDHIDRDFRNDDISNLRVLSLSEHLKDDALRVRVQDSECSWCGTIFQPTKSQRNEVKEKAGPFCSKSCAGRYGAYIQNGGSKMERVAVQREYYRNDKEIASMVE